MTTSGFKTKRMHSFCSLELIFSSRGSGSLIKIQSSSPRTESDMTLQPSRSRSTLASRMIQPSVRMCGH